MTQPTTELLQAIKGLADCPFCGSRPRHYVHRRDERYGYVSRNEISCSGCTASVFANDPKDKNGWAIGSGMLEAIAAWNRRSPTLIAALELKERVENPKTVELIARVICADDPDVRMGDCEAVVQQRVQHEWKHYKRTAEAAIQALKGQTDELS
jgi:hypothetical protein